jgi:hypothetical protein
MASVSFNARCLDVAVTHSPGLTGGQRPIRQTPIATSLPSGGRGEVASFQMFRLSRALRRTERARMCATLRGTLPRHAKRRGGTERFSEGGCRESCEPQRDTAAPEPYLSGSSPNLIPYRSAIRYSVRRSMPSTSAARVRLRRTA